MSSIHVSMLTCVISIAASFAPSASASSAPITVSPVIGAPVALALATAPAAVALVGAPAAAPLVGAPKVKWSAPSAALMDGRPYIVHVDLEAPEDGAPLATWMLEAAAFQINGKALGEKGETHTLRMSPRMKMSIDLDIAPAVAEMKDLPAGTFKLGYAKEVIESADIEVVLMQPAEKGLDFMKMPLENLAKYQVYMETNRGVMHVALWSDVAPNTVRNFLDLCYTGYYDNVIFHRVIPGFMIQGGDKTGTGTGKGPRTVNAEFNDRKHEPGVLSMARAQNDPNSATSQFFVMHGASPQLDGQYTAFGKLISGLDVVDKIVNARTIAQDKPLDPQVIVHATVIRTK